MRYMRSFENIQGYTCLDVFLAGCGLQITLSGKALVNAQGCGLEKRSELGHIMLTGEVKENGGMEVEDLITRSQLLGG